MIKASEIDHSRCLCHLPDIQGFDPADEKYILREDFDANPPLCRCCSTPLISEPAEREGKVVAWLYRYFCPNCRAYQEKQEVLLSERLRGCSEGNHSWREIGMVTLPGGSYVVRWCQVCGSRDTSYGQGINITNPQIIKKLFPDPNLKFREGAISDEAAIFTETARSRQRNAETNSDIYDRYAKGEISLDRAMEASLDPIGLYRLIMFSSISWNEKQQITKVVLENDWTILEGHALKVLSEFLKVPIIDLGEVELNLDIVRMVDSELIKRHKILPIRLEGVNLIVAMVDPLNLTAIGVVRLVAGCNVAPHICGEKAFSMIVLELFGVKSDMYN